nr:ketopantoate reductase family protein [Spirochaetaceae bacterium]
INSKSCQFNIKSINRLDQKPDLILVCVKNYTLEQISALLKKAARPGTIILSVLNGITSEPFLQNLLPESIVLYSAVLGMDAVKENNQLIYTSKGKVLLGSLENRKIPEVSIMSEFLNECELGFSIPEDIHREIWYKLMINIGVNQISAITGASYGSFQQNRNLQELMEKAMKETISVARAENVNLCEEDLNRWYKVLHTLGPDGKTSMLQDIEAKRKTEVETFAGELLRRAAKLNIDVPVNDTLYSLIKTRESLYL